MSLRGRAIAYLVALHVLFAAVAVYLFLDNPFWLIAIEVVFTASLVAGLRLSRERRPDLIVVEFAPPRQASLALVRAFRSDASTASIPLVALSTTLGDADRDLLLAEGIAAYMVKPCPPLALLAEARRLLGN